MICRAAAADLLARGGVFRVGRVHGARARDLLVAEHAVAEIRVGDGGKIIPLRRALRLGHRLQLAQRPLVFLHEDVPPGRLHRVSLRPALLIALPVPAGKGIVLILPLLRVRARLRIFDLVVGGVDLVHHLCRVRVARVHVRVIFFCQRPVGALDLLVARVRRQPQNAVGIVDHACSSCCGRNAASNRVQTPE